MKGFLENMLRLLDKAHLISKAQGWMYQNSTRNVVSKSYEPSLSPTSIERPGVLVLYQYQDHRHHIARTGTSVGKRVANYCSMKYMDVIRNDYHWKGRLRPPYFNEHTEIAAACEELHCTLLNEVGIILITVDAPSSAIAQFYLESHSVSGLLMVDPVLPPTKMDINSTEDEEGAGRFLKLEPGAVPTMIFSQSSNTTCLDKVVLHHEALHTRIPKCYSWGDDMFSDLVLDWIDEECIL